MTVNAFGDRAGRRAARRSLGNLLRMGHCAPTVMQTLLEASDVEARRLVTLTAGLPGGIGDTGGECGGITAPLILLGLRYGDTETDDGLPLAVVAGHDLVRRFTARCGSSTCREIRGNARVPRSCIGVVRRAPVLCAETIACPAPDAVPAERRAAYRQLHAHWQREHFHCARAVLAAIPQIRPTPTGLDDAVVAFQGGTLFTGRTCSALTAGVMALGLIDDEIEDSRPRVARMIALMAVGGDAFADDVNAFNRPMNQGHDLARWFTTEFGDIRCRALTGCDFGTVEGVRRYLDADGTARCRRIAAAVAEQVTRRSATDRRPGEEA